MRILYDCFSCSPYYGSDEGLGWMWPYKMSKYHEVWVLIRKDRKEGIDRYCKREQYPRVFTLYIVICRIQSTSIIRGRQITRTVHLTSFFINTSGNMSPCLLQRRRIRNTVLTLFTTQSQTIFVS